MFMIVNRNLYLIIVRTKIETLCTPKCLNSNISWSGSLLINKLLKSARYLGHNVVFFLQIPLHCYIFQPYCRNQFRLTHHQIHKEGNLCHLCGLVLYRNWNLWDNLPNHCWFDIAILPVKPKTMIKCMHSQQKIEIYCEYWEPDIKSNLTL